MKTLTSTIGTIFLVLLLGFPVSVLGSYVLVQISSLYEIPVLSNLSLLQFYGISVIFSLLTGSGMKEGEEKEVEFPNIIVKLLQRTLIVLTGWGMAYLFHLIMS